MRPRLVWGCVGDWTQRARSVRFTEFESIGEEILAADRDLAMVAQRRPFGRRFPLSRLDPAARWKLALAVLAGLYVGFTTYSVAAGGVLRDGVGCDYRSFYASASIARDHGFAAVYDLGLQEGYQRQIFDSAPGPWISSRESPLYETVPSPFLPAFILLFVPFSFLPPVTGFAAWTVVNLVGLVAYMRHFALRIGARGPSLAPAIALLSYASFMTLYVGQVNVILLIASGESLIALNESRPLRAGLWLGMLLLKPQLLVVLCAGLLLARSFRGLLGLLTSGAALVMVSIGLAGTRGFFDLLALIGRYVGGLPTNKPEFMMNWRALGLVLGRFAGAPSVVSWLAIAAGMAATFAVGLRMWRIARGRDAKGAPRLHVATWLATFGVAWHSHVTMALCAMPAFVSGVSEGVVSMPLLALWALLPTVV